MNKPKYDRKREQKKVDDFVAAWIDNDAKHSVVHEIATMSPAQSALFATRIYETLLQHSLREADDFVDLLRTYAI